MSIKLIVAGAAFVLITAALVLFARTITHPKVAPPAPPADPAEQPTPAKPSHREGKEEICPATQELLPVADIKGPVLLQKHGTAVNYVKVECKNY